MSETNKIMTSLQFPGGVEPYVINDARIPQNPDPYMQLVTDGEGQAGWEQRLAWKEENIEETAILDNQVIPYQEVTSQDVWTGVLPDIAFKVGFAYALLYNGKSYETVCYDEGTIAFEKVELPGGTVHEFIFQPKFESLFIRDISKAGYTPDEIVVSLLEVEKTVTINKISPEYLPEGIGYKTYDILPETAVSSEAPQITLLSPLVDGKEYKVVWDGVSYNCDAKNYDGFIVIGNNAIYEYDNGDTTDTGEPFAIECGSESSSDEIQAYVYFASDDMGTHKVSIVDPVGIVHPIPAEYLPDTSFTFYLVSDENENLTMTQTFSELLAAVEAKKTINVVFDYSAVDGGEVMVNKNVSVTQGYPNSNDVCDILKLGTQPDWSSIVGSSASVLFDLITVNSDETFTVKTMKIAVSEFT